MLSLQLWVFGDLVQRRKDMVLRELSWISALLVYANSRHWKDNERRQESFDRDSKDKGADKMYGNLRLIFPEGFVGRVLVSELLNLSRIPMLLILMQMVLSVETKCKMSREHSIAPTLAGRSLSLHHVLFVTNK